MLKKAITFENLDGEQVTEIFHFHLNKAEVAAMELSAKGNSLSEVLKQIVKDEDGAKIIEMFNMLISTSYGRRGADGKQFEKSPELSQRFMQSDAYSELFMELVTNANAGAEFVNGIMPANLVSSSPATGPRLIQDVPLGATGPQISMDQANSTLASAEGPKPLVKQTPIELDPANMSREDLQAAFEQFRQKQAAQQ